jgi:hypothetical protein
MTAQPNRDSILSWRKSRASGPNGGCVEVAKSESSVLVRDSRDPTGSTLELTWSQWRELVRHIKTGRRIPARGHDVA